MNFLKGKDILGRGRQLLVFLGQNIIAVASIALTILAGSAIYFSNEIAYWQYERTLEQYPYEVNATDQELASKDIDRVFAIQAQIYQILGGLALLLGIWVTFRRTRVAERSLETTNKNLEITEKGHFTERFTKAVDQLGSSQKAVQIGGIYALEKLAQERIEYHNTIFEILCAFVQEYFSVKNTETDSSEYNTVVLAIIKVIGRRTRPEDEYDGLIDLSNTVLKDVNFSQQHQIDLSTSNFNNSQLKGVTFSKVNFARSHLLNTQLDNVNFYISNLEGATLTQTKLDHTVIENSILERAAFYHATVSNSRFSDVKMTKLRFRALKMEDTSFFNSELKRVDFTEANLIAVRFDFSNLIGVYFKNTVLKHLVFEHTKLMGARFERANLEDVVFDHADLRKASFFDANLGNSSFRNTNIEGVDFTMANLESISYDKVEDFMLVDSLHRAILGEELRSFIEKANPKLLNEN